MTATSPAIARYLRCGIVCGALFLAVFAASSGSAESMKYLDTLSPVSSLPSDLLCAHPQKVGAQFIACDAYKDYAEPISPIIDLGKTKLAIRFVYIPSFHTWSIVRVEISTHTYGEGKSSIGVPEAMVTVRSETEDNSANVRSLMEADAKAPFVRSFKLTPDELWLLMGIFSSTDVYSLPSLRPEKNSCLDGTEYVAEFAEGSHYHWVSLSCRYEADPREDSLYRLSALLALIVRAHLMQELIGFPGD